jgi:hypothetical protein
MKHTQKILIALAFLLCAMDVRAAAPATPCWPTDPKTTKVWNVPSGVSKYGQLATWDCGGFIHSMYFDWIEVAAYLQRYAAGAMTVSDANTFYAQTVDTVPATASETAFFRKIYVNEYNGQPVVLSPGTAYRRDISGTGEKPIITYKVVGTVVVGTPCYRQPESKAGDQMPVPRSAVTVPKFILTIPLPVYAPCG